MKACLLLVMLALTLSTSAQQASAGDVTGVWTGQISDPHGNDHDLSFMLKCEGNKVTGTIDGAPPNGAKRTITDGRVEGDHVSLEFNGEAPDGSPMKHTFVGEISGNQIKGTLESRVASLQFTVTKK